MGNKHKIIPKGLTMGNKQTKFQNLDEVRSVVLDSEYIERDIRGVGMLLHHASRSMLEDHIIDEIDYLTLKVLADKLLDDIAPKIQKLIEASYELLKATK
jgi:hypothetical protein